MSDDYPTWNSVGIPMALVEQLRQLPINRSLNLLIFDKVFICRKKINTTYTCDECHNKYSTNRIYEDYSVCDHCGNSKIRAEFSLAFSKTNLKEIDFTVERDDFKPIFLAMKYNFLKYFSTSPEEIVDFGWNERSMIFYCQFVGGEMAYDDELSHAVFRASILCPYLWDNRFNWQEAKRETNKELESAVSPDIIKILQVCNGRLE